MARVLWFCFCCLAVVAASYVAAFVAREPGAGFWPTAAAGFVLGCLAVTLWLLSVRRETVVTRTILVVARRAGSTPEEDEETRAAALEIMGDDAEFFTKRRFAARDDGRWREEPPDGEGDEL